MGALASIAQMGVSIDAGNEQTLQKLQDAQANKDIASKGAVDSMMQGYLQASQVRQKGTQTVGAQKVGYVASGVDPSSGTPLDAAGQTGYLTDLDAKTAENNAAREAWGFKKQAQKYQRQIDYLPTQNNEAIAGTVLGTAGKLLNSGSGGGSSSGGGDSGGFSFG